MPVLTAVWQVYFTANTDLHVQESSMKRVMVLAILGFMLSACGQKGPLYLPEASQSLQAGASVEDNVTLRGE